MNISKIKRTVYTESTLLNLNYKGATLFGDLKILDPLRKLNTPELILGSLFSINLKYKENYWYLPVFKNEKYLDLQNNIYPILKLKLSTISNHKLDITIKYNISLEKIENFCGIRYYTLEENINVSGINNNSCSSRYSTNYYCLGVCYYYGIVSYFINEPKFDIFINKNEKNEISDEVFKIDKFIL